MMYRLFNLFLAPLRLILFLLFGAVGLFFVPLDIFILWPVAYLFNGRNEPFFISYFDWFSNFVFSDWI